MKEQEIKTVAREILKSFRSEYMALKDKQMPLTDELKGYHKLLDYFSQEFVNAIKARLAN